MIALQENFIHLSNDWKSEQTIIDKQTVPEE